MYEAIDTNDFGHKLKWLNSNLWIDPNHATTPYEQGYEWVGLYNGSKYEFGIPRFWIPKYSIIALEQGYLQRFADEFSPQDLEDIWKHGLLPDFWKEKVNQRLYLRGLIPILSDLVRRNVINHKQAEKLFEVSFTPQRLVYPANFIKRYF